jgi:hypothetical protein
VRYTFFTLVVLEEFHALEGSGTADEFMAEFGLVLVVAIVIPGLVVAIVIPGLVVAIVIPGLVVAIVIPGLVVAIVLPGIDLLVSISCLPISIVA